MNSAEPIPDYACVLENELYYGNARPAKDEEILIKLGVKSIVDLIKYTSEDKIIKHSDSFNVLHLQVEDLPTNTIAWCEEPAKFIDEQLSLHNIVYVHCAQGVSRSSALVIYYLMTRKKQGLKQTFNFIRYIRPVACPSFGFMKGLSELEQKNLGRTSFSPEDYTIMCISEIAPNVKIEDIIEIYQKVRDEVRKKQQFYDEAARSRNIEPIGFYTIDKIMEKFGKDSVLKRYGCSLHHPFD